MSQPPGRRRRWAILGLQVIAFLGVFAAVHAWQTRDLVPVGEALPAPALGLPDLSGRVHTLADLGGRPALVYFFAPWCRVCAASADNLERLARWREGQVSVLLVALDYEGISDVAGYAQRHGLDMPILLGDRAAAERWRVPGYPTYYVLDARGRVRHRDFGYSTFAGLWWRTWLAGLTDENPGHPG